MKKSTGSYVIVALALCVQFAGAETIEEAKAKAAMEQALSLAEKTAVAVPLTTENKARTSDDYSRLKTLFNTGKQPLPYKIKGEWNRVAQITGPGGTPDYDRTVDKLLFTAVENPFAPNGYAIYLEKYGSRVTASSNENSRSVTFTVNLPPSFRFDYECRSVNQGKLLLCRVNVKAHGDYVPNPWYEGYEKLEPEVEDEDDGWIL